METLSEFKEKVLHKKDDLFAILFLNPISVRLAYFIKKYNLGITPNQITWTRLLILGPLVILCLFLAPFLGLKIFYLLALFFSYSFLFSDWWDGMLARGMNTASLNGAFLDSIADRWSTIILFVTIFSIGLWFNNVILVYGAVSLFVLKTFHMMIITKIFYYKKDVDNLELFAGEDAKQILGITMIESFLLKTNSFLKIKKWGCTFGGAGRYFFTIMLPLILLIFNLEMIVIIFSYILIFSFGISFIVRIKNLLK